MGREIRRVIPNWEHPRYTAEDAPFHDRIGAYKPLLDESYAAAKRDWLEGLAKWEAGERPSYWTAGEHSEEFWEWDGQPPQRGDFRPDWPEGSATWFQFYETVSEGTPLSPPFATENELIEWLSTHADFWGHGPRSRESAERMVRSGWAPSAVFVNGAVHMNTDALDVIASGREVKG